MIFYEPDTGNAVIFKPVEYTINDGFTLRGWCTEKRGLPVIVFSHGNGFSAGTYFPMLNVLAREFDLVMLDHPGHGRSDQVHPYAGWNKTAEYTHEGLQSLLRGYSSQVFAVGHSLGGVLLLLSTFQHPQSYRGLVLLDPVLFPRSMLMFMRLVSAVGMTARIHPFVKPTLRRKSSWASREEAIGYLRGRVTYKRWSDESLSSFANHALTESPGGVLSLCCPPSQEADYFSTLPDKLWASLKSISCDTRLYMGEDTYPFALRAARTAAKINDKITMSVVPGDHCFMQESPELAAEGVRKTIVDLLEPESGAR